MGIDSGIESIHAELHLCPLRQELVRGLGGAELPCRHLLLEEFVELGVAASFELHFRSAIDVPYALSMTLTHLGHLEVEDDTAEERRASEEVACLDAPISLLRG
jgi:hypothetical protein